MSSKEKVPLSERFPKNILPHYLQGLGEGNNLSYRQFFRGAYFTSCRLKLLAGWGLTGILFAFWAGRPDQEFWDLFKNKKK